MTGVVGDRQQTPLIRHPRLRDGGQDLGEPVPLLLAAPPLRLVIGIGALAGRG